PTPPAADPALAAWNRARRRRASILIAAALLAALAWTLCAPAALNDWGVFRATPKTPNTTYPANGRWQRDETHLLLGRGRLIVFTMHTYSDTFNPAGSTALAWAVAPKRPIQW